MKLETRAEDVYERKKVMKMPPYNWFWSALGLILIIILILFLVGRL